MRRRNQARLATGAVLVAALAAGVASVVVALDDDETPLTVATGSERPVAAPPSADEATRAVRELLDRSTPLVTAAAHVDASDAAAVVQAIRDVGARAGAVPDGVRVDVSAVGADIAVARAVVPLGQGTGPADAVLANIVLVRRGERWLVTREAACGIPHAGGMLGPSPAPCAEGPSFATAEGLPTRAALLREPSGRPAPLRWRSAAELLSPSDLVATPDGTALLGFEYPEVQMGGGGPIGHAELVRIDAASGQETGRVVLAGGSAMVMATADDIWVTHVLGLEGERPSVSERLVRIDPRTFRVTAETELGLPSPAAFPQVAAAGRWAWVFDGAALVRYGPDLREAGRIAVPPGDLATLVATPARVLLQRGVGSDLAVDADTLAVTDVLLPDGLPASSGGAVWFHDDGPVLRRLDPDGTVATAPDLGVDGSLVGDGRGGAWFRGTLGTEWGDGTANPLMVDALGRSVAVHLDDRGSVDRTISSTAGPTGAVYFNPAGDHVIATWSEGYGLVGG